MPPASAMVIGMPSASIALDGRVPTMMGVCSEVNSLLHTCRFKTDMESGKQFTRLNWPRTRARGERKWYTGRSVHVECFGESGPKSGEASTSGRSQELDADGLKSSVLLLEQVDVEDAGRTSSSVNEARPGVELSPPLPSKVKNGQDLK